jgi:lipoprotein-releasing system permease protein
MKKNKLLLLIAKKYLFSKKSYSIINIISAISVLGVAVGTMALIVVLSVFNGFEDVILKLYNNFYSDFKIESSVGKTININDFPYSELKESEDILSITQVVEELALARYGDNQHLITLKGVSEEYLLSGNIDSIIIIGEAILKRNNNNYGIFGIGVAYYLGININDYVKNITIYAPKRKSKASLAQQDFISDNVLASGVFSVQQEFDENYVIVPIEVAKNLYEYNNEISSVEIICKKNINIKKTKKFIEEIIDNKYIVKDKFQQQEFIYKILKSEKLAIFLILSFILIVATFNVIGILSMIILEKKQDISILSAIGAPLTFLRKLFIAEGMMIVSLGAIIGLILGVILCILQQKYGLISIGNGDGGFIIQYYPVKIKISDILIILSTVGIIGLLSAIIPSRKINEKFINLNEKD